MLIPNSTAASDHSRFADDLRKCIDWIEARDSDTNSLATPLPNASVTLTRTAGASSVDQALVAEIIAPLLAA